MCLDHYISTYITIQERPEEAVVVKSTRTIKYEAFCQPQAANMLQLYLRAGFLSLNNLELADIVEAAGIKHYCFKLLISYSHNHKEWLQTSLVWQ